MMSETHSGGARATIRRGLSELGESAREREILRVAIIFPFCSVFSINLIKQAAGAPDRARAANLSERPLGSSQASVPWAGPSWSPIVWPCDLYNCSSSCSVHLEGSRVASRAELSLQGREKSSSISRKAA